MDRGTLQVPDLRAKGWDFTSPNGTSNDYNAGANNGRADHWLKMNVSGGENGKVYTGDLPTAATGKTIAWSSRLGVNEKFALVTGNNDSYMMTPVFAIGGLDEAVITFEHGYNLTTGATISVELSTDGGNTYNIVLFTITSDGSTNVGSSGNYTDFGKNKMVLDLGDYLGYNNLRVRFNFDGVRDGDVWAVDNIRVPEGPQGVLLQWFYDE
jgi:large repetitive protein